MQIKRAAAILLAIAAASVAAMIIFRFVPLHDFVEYWTAAYALAHGQNPYSLEAMMKLQRALGWNEEQPLMVMSPPQFLPLLLPLGFMHSYAFARLIWFWLSGGILAFEALTLWSIYGGDTDRRWIALCVGALFFPVWHCLAVAQIAPLLLLGVVGFLWLEQRGYLFRAGCALAFTTFKPHLFYLLWLALFVWSVRRREMRVIAGASISVCLGLLAALIVDHAALSQYWVLVRTDYIWNYTSGSGGALRSLFGKHNHLLQFVPMFPGIVGLAWYWRRYRAEWQWSTHLPLVLTLSVLTAAYGWPFDEVVLLVPVVMIAVKVINTRFVRIAAAWLLAHFVASLACVVRFGDAAAMTVCVTGVLAYLIFDSVTKRDAGRPLAPRHLYPAYVPERSANSAESGPLV